MAVAGAAEPARRRDGRRRLLLVVMLRVGVGVCVRVLLLLEEEQVLHHLLGPHGERRLLPRAAGAARLCVLVHRVSRVMSWMGVVPYGIDRAMFGAHTQHIAETQTERTLSRGSSACVKLCMCSQFHWGAVVVAWVNGRKRSAAGRPAWLHT